MYSGNDLEYDSKEIRSHDLLVRNFALTIVTLVCVILEGGRVDVALQVHVQE